VATARAADAMTPARVAVSDWRIYPVVCVFCAVMLAFAFDLIDMAVAALRVPGHFLH
jgi:hypothetical protein